MTIYGLYQLKKDYIEFRRLYIGCKWIVPKALHTFMNHNWTLQCVDGIKMDYKVENFLLLELGMDMQCIRKVRSDYMWTKFVPLNEINQLAMNSTSTRVFSNGFFSLWSCTINRLQMDYIWMILIPSNESINF